MKDPQEDPSLEQAHFMQQSLPHKLDDTSSKKLCECNNFYHKQWTAGTNNYICIIYLYNLLLLAHGMDRVGSQLTNTLSGTRTLIEI